MEVSQLSTTKRIIQCLAKKPKPHEDNYEREKKKIFIKERNKEQLLYNLRSYLILTCKTTTKTNTNFCSNNGDF